MKRAAMKRSVNRRPRRSGFTLMELLVVLGILVLLVALVTPKILGTQEKADINFTRTQVGSFKGALERYHFDMRGFPTSEQGLQSLVTTPSGGDGTTSTRWDGPYTNSDSLPKDPWGNPYQYAYPPTNGTGKYPDIWSAGPDGQDGTEDDICSWTTTAVDGEESLGEDLGGELGDELGDGFGGDDLLGSDLGGGMEPKF
ncbi:MAG: type II secretion system major pseudopilin GspG [Thermoguttaceae bacterium]